MDQTRGIGPLWIGIAVLTVIVLMLDADGTLPKALTNLGKSIASLRPSAAAPKPAQTSASSTVGGQTAQLITGSASTPWWQAALFGPVASVVHTITAAPTNIPKANQ